MSDDETSLQSLPTTHGCTGLKRLAWLVDTAYVASWIQGAGQMAVVPHVRHWHEGKRLSHPALRASAEILQVDMEE